MKSRLQKLMAEANVASRRAAEELIERGRVRVNGKVATLGDKADPETDVIEVDGQRLRFDTQKRVYFALYKPRNVLTTTGDPHHGDERRTVMDFVPYNGHLFTIGRLDADSEGLVVLTNDGELTNKLTHPRFRHTKTYKVTVYGLPSEDVIQRWEEGIWLEDEGRTAPCSVVIVKGGQRETILRIVMTEGKKRQIRRVAIALGHPVSTLVRTHIGQLSVEGLRPGEWRELDSRDVKALSTPSPVLRTLPGKQQRGRRSDRPAAREEGELRDRPRRSYGDSERSDQPRRGSGESSERGFGRPQRDYDANERNFDRPRRRSLVDDAPEDSAERRPRRSFEDRRQGDSEARSKRPRGTGGKSSFGDRPRRAFDDTSRGEDRPRRPRRDSEGDRQEDDRSARPPRRFEGDRSKDHRSARPPRRFASSRTQGDRPPRRQFDDKPRDDSEKSFGRSRRPFDDKTGDENRPRREFEIGRREGERPRRRPDSDSTPGDRRSSGSRGSAGGGRREGEYPPRRSSERTSQDESKRNFGRPRRPGAEGESDQRQSGGDRPRSARGPAGSRRDDAQGRPPRGSGNRSRPRRDDERSEGRSSGAPRRPSNPRSRRSNEERDEE